MAHGNSESVVHIVEIGEIVKLRSKQLVVVASFLVLLVGAQLSEPASSSPSFGTAEANAPQLPKMPASLQGMIPALDSSGREVGFVSLAELDSGVEAPVLFDANGRHIGKYLSPTSLQPVVATGCASKGATDISTGKVIAATTCTPALVGARQPGPIVVSSG